MEEALLHLHRKLLPPGRKGVAIHAFDIRRSVPRVALHGLAVATEIPCLTLAAMRAA